MALSKEEKVTRLKQRREEKYNNTHKVIDNITYKICDLCNEWKPSTLEYYYKNKSNGIDNLSNICKQCTVQKSMLHDKEHPEQRKINKQRWDAKHENLLIRRWYEDKKRERGYYQEYYAKYPEKLVEYNYRRRLKKHQITKEEWVSCKKYFNNSCAYCGVSNKDVKINQGQYLHKEHVVNDGSNGIDNCIPACRLCNSLKWQFDMEEWYRRQEFFNEERLNKIYQWLELNKFTE